MIYLLLLASLVFAGTTPEGLAWLEENKGGEGVIQLASGMQYKVLRKGDGAFHPTVDAPCECHYAGTLLDGTEFDSSYSRGSPSTFAPNQVIKGWTEAMQMMVEGDKWELYIPSELAYGERGSPPKIPGGSVLIFTIELITINGGKVPASRCNPFTTEDCNAKEVKWLNKIDGKYGKDPEKLQIEIKRLEGMQNKPMKETLIQWIQRRITLLNTLIEGESKAEL